MMKKVSNKPCTACQAPGLYCSGVPGVLASTQHGLVERDATVERCDTCSRYATDAEAYSILDSLGMIPPDYAQSLVPNTDRYAIKLRPDGYQILDTQSDNLDLVVLVPTTDDEHYDMDIALPIASRVATMLNKQEDERSEDSTD